MQRWFARWGVLGWALFLYHASSEISADWWWELSYSPLFAGLLVLAHAEWMSRRGR